VSRGVSGSWALYLSWAAMYVEPFFASLRRLTIRSLVQTSAPPSSCPVSCCSNLLISERPRADWQVCCSIGSRPPTEYPIARCMERCTPWRSGRTSVPILSCKLHGLRASHRLYSQTRSIGSMLTLSFSASLAGLLWRTILAQKDRFVTQKEFLQYNWLPVIVTMIVGCLIVAGEVCVIYKD
jgi:hypothetical protein